MRRLRPVVARAIFQESVLFEISCGEVSSIIDRLVHPVPDAAADAIDAAFNDVPVFLQVAHRVSHGVGIFTHEVRLTPVVSVGVVAHLRQRRIHLAADVRAVVHVGICGTLIVNGSRIEVAHGVVGGADVRTLSALVAETPEDDGGVVAVAAHHAGGAVHILSTPGRLV